MSLEKDPYRLAQRIAVTDDEQSLFMALGTDCCCVCVEQNAWIHFSDNTRSM